MEIIRTNNTNLSKAALYKMTKSPERIALREACHSGEIIAINDFVIFESETATGVTTNIAIDDGSRIIVTNSKTFIQEFTDLLDIFGDELKAVKVLTGRTKNGRNFMTCTLAE